MDDRYMQKIEALHAAVAQGSLREVQAMLGRAKLALSKVNMRMVKIPHLECFPQAGSCPYCRHIKAIFKKPKNIGH